MSVSGVTRKVTSAKPPVVGPSRQRDARDLPLIAVVARIALAIAQREKWTKAGTQRDSHADAEQLGVVRTEGGQ
jgi:hypothetical protein